ncbi:MAG TPA: hypothetical protein VL202_07975 [Pararhizobium sp.]|nr:hypothetical protein [Pararhizobium sp.]
MFIYKTNFAAYFEDVDEARKTGSRAKHEWKPASGHCSRNGFLLPEETTMPEMMGVALLIDMLAKSKRKTYEFDDLKRRNRLADRLTAAARRLRQRWM